MGRFGSFKLRIVWASIFLFLFVLCLLGFSISEGTDGFAVHAFGATIPPHMLDGIRELAMQYLRTMLRNIIVWAVPFTFLATAYFPLVEAIESSKFKGFFMGTLVGAANGLFYSQLLILPIWAFSARIMDSLWPATLVMADLHAVILGVQLLIWCIIFNRLIRSNRGIPMLLALGLSAVGSKLAYLVDFGETIGMSDGQVRLVEFLNHFLPSQHVAESSIAMSTLTYGILGSLAVAAVLILLPLGKGKT